ncbi:unnamed protein product, partial [Rotaria sp. Silwood1]
MSPTLPPVCGRHVCQDR